MKIYAVSALATTLLASNAFAERPDVVQRGKPLDPQQLYFVKYDCKVQERRLPGYLAAQRDWTLFTRPKAATHFFAITTKDVNLASNTFEAAGTTGFAPRQVFTVNGSNIVAQGGGACGGTLLAYGGDSPKIAYSLKYETQSLPSSALQAITLLKDIIAPVFRIVKADDLAVKDAEAVNKVGEVIKSYKDYLELFKDETRSTSSIVDLKVGDNFVRTSVSEIRIKVTPAPELLTASGIPFRSNFDELVNLNSKLEEDKAYETCSKAQQSLLRAGFKSYTDQAYILYRSAEFENKESFIKCLDPNELAPYVINNRRLFKDAITERLLITEDDVRNYVTSLGKPIFEREEDRRVSKVISSLVDILGRYGTLGVLIDNDKTELSAMSAETISVNDKTNSAVISDRGTEASDVKTITTGTARDQLPRLVGKGYTSFGCYHLTRSAPDIAGFDGATAMLLAGKSDDKEKKETIGLRLFFASGVLKEIVATNKLVPELRSLVNGCTL